MGNSGNGGIRDSTSPEEIAEAISGFPLGEDPSFDLEFCLDGRRRPGRSMGAPGYAAAVEDCQITGRDILAHFHDGTLELLYIQISVHRVGHKNYLTAGKGHRSRPIRACEAP